MEALMRLLLAAILALTVLPVRGDEVPFAQPAPSLDQHRQSYAVALSDAMELTQLRHTKLWLAGNAKNWSLTNYEPAQLKDTFDKAAILYLNIPVKNIAAVEKPRGAWTMLWRRKTRRSFDAASWLCKQLVMIVIRPPMLALSSFRRQGHRSSPTKASPRGGESSSSPVNGALMADFRFGEVLQSRHHAFVLRAEGACDDRHEKRLGVSWSWCSTHTRSPCGVSVWKSLMPISPEKAGLSCIGWSKLSVVVGTKAVTVPCRTPTGLSSI
jgi:hypothetical protein